MIGIQSGMSLRNKTKSINCGHEEVDWVDGLLPDCIQYAEKSHQEVGKNKYNFAKKKEIVKTR